MSSMPPQSSVGERNPAALLAGLPSLSEKLEASLADANQAILAVGTNFESIGTTLHRLLASGRGRMTVSRTEAESMFQAVSRIVVALQFEDILSQRIRHVARTLDQISADLGLHPLGEHLQQVVEVAPGSPVGNFDLF